MTAARRTPRSPAGRSGAVRRDHRRRPRAVSSLRTPAATSHGRCSTGPLPRRRIFVHPAAVMWACRSRSRVARSWVRYSRAPPPPATARSRPRRDTGSRTAPHRGVRTRNRNASASTVTTASSTPRATASVPRKGRRRFTPVPDGSRPRQVPPASEIAAHRTSAPSAGHQCAAGRDHGLRPRRTPHDRAPPHLSPVPPGTTDGSRSDPPAQRGMIALHRTSPPSGGRNRATERDHRPRPRVMIVVRRTVPPPRPGQQRAGGGDQGGGGIGRARTCRRRAHQRPGHEPG